MTTTADHSRPQGHPAVVVSVAAVLMVGGLIGITLAPAPSMGDLLPRSVALLTIAALYLLAEMVHLNFELGRHGLGVTIGDLPLILGAYLLDPPLLLAACLVGALSIRSARQTPPLKAAFNLSVDVAEIGIACLLVSVLKPVNGDTDTWWAPYVIVLVVNMMSLLAVIVAIRYLDAPMTTGEGVSMTLTVIVSGAFSATLAIICLLVLNQRGYGLVLLVVVAAVLALIYRSYATMLRRHADLGQLMVATQDLNEGHAKGRLAEALVNQAQRLVRADRARLIRGDQPRLDALLEGRDQLLIPPRSRSQLQRAWLSENGYTDALLIKVGNANGAIGTLVITDRVGNAGTFTPDDLRRMHMLVRHAEALWANGLLTQRLHHDASHDSLTGLSNRPHLLIAITQLLQATVVTSGPLDEHTCDGALLLLDLDRFKEVNDSLGHPAGDILLTVVADRLRALAPASSLVARLGGDEFGLLLNASSVTEVMLQAQRVRELLLEPITLQETRVEIGCAIGIALIPHDGLEASTILRRADVAMHAAKRSGRITRYHSTLDTASVDRLEILGDLRRSLDDGTVRPWFQPKVDLRTGRVVGFEALARWEHPTRGLVFPDEFVPLAEQGGLAAPLTATILARSLIECRRWSAWVPGISVAVNVPARQLEDDGFADMVARVLHESGLPAKQLTLEITEGSAVPGHLEALRSLSDVRDLGVRISVDDFGTGYSALGYLHRLPVDEVKIDKSFVMPMRAQPEAEAIVSTIIDLSSRLSIETVAEGVEDEAVAEQLVRMGCGMAQGFMVSRPLPAHRVVTWLRDYTPLSRQTSCPYPANSQTGSPN